MASLASVWRLPTSIPTPLARPDLASNCWKRRSPAWAAAMSGTEDPRSHICTVSPCTQATSDDRDMCGFHCSSPTSALLLLPLLLLLLPLPLLPLLLLLLPPAVPLEVPISKNRCCCSCTGCPSSSTKMPFRLHVCPGVIFM